MEVSPLTHYVAVAKLAPKRTVDTMHLHTQLLIIKPKSTNVFQQRNRQGSSVALRDESRPSEAQHRGSSQDDKLPSGAVACI